MATPTKKLSFLEECLVAAGNGAEGQAIAAILEYKANELYRMQKDAWHDAMRACQSDMAPISKDATNPQTRSKYVSLPSLDAALRPIYIKHGFDVTFSTDVSLGPDTSRRVVMDIAHEAGYSRRFCVDMPVCTTGIKGTQMMTLTHAAASALTYGRRYLLCLGFNIATEDDDGNAASPKPSGKPPVDTSHPVSDADVQTLITLCDEVGANKRSMCQYLGKKWGIQCDALGDIPKAKMGEVLGMLERKREEGKGKQAKQV